MRVPLIAGNWKMNGSRALADQILASLLEVKSNSVEVAVFPPYLFLPQAQALLAGSPVKLGAQNMNANDQGAYTGEISAKMLQESGCEYVLIGHSERRELYHETNESCLAKTITAQAAGLTPVLCVGETLQAYEAGQTFDVIEHQLHAVLHHLKVEAKALVLAYEPVWAIGTGKTATPEWAQSVHEFIRRKLSAWLGSSVAEQMRILYGGSVKAENAAGLLAQPDIDGALVGGASLVAESFIGIINAVGGECVSPEMMRRK